MAGWVAVNNGIHFSQFSRLEVHGEGACGFSVRESPVLVHRWLIAQRPPMRRGVGSALGPLSQGTDPIHGGPTLMT